MAVCLNCGVENPEGFQFCGACAAPLTARVTSAHAARKTVTIVFCDLVGSTALAELLDPESLRAVMDRYFTTMRSVLESHGGIVEKFIGDAVMAVFGLPRSHEDDPIRAARAAAEMGDELVVLNGELARRWGVTLTNRTGINTGEVVVGDPASGQRLASGDAINVAARLEQAASPGEVLVGDATHHLVKDAVMVEEIVPLSLKGKAERVRAFKLIRLLPGVANLARRFDSPLVGRAAEMSLLEAAFERAVARTGCELVTVVGEAGQGKSRLVRGMLTLLTNRARTLQGRCLSYGKGITFWTVAEVIKQAAGIADDDPFEKALGKLSSLLPGQEADPITDRLSALIGLTSRTFAVEEIYWAVKKALEALAQKEPLAIVFEDVHWGEPAFLDFIGQLSESRQQAAVLVVCTARPELLEDHPGWTQGRANVAAVELTALSTAESEALIDNFGDASKLSRETRTAIIRSAQGNPLFVEQIVSMLIEDDRRHSRDEPGSARSTPIPIPSTLTGLLSARLDTLADEERAVLGAASVVGEVFYKGALEDLCEQRLRPRISECLTSLTQRKLLRPDISTFVDEQAFAFRHILIRDAAYQEMLKGTRAELHRLFASWLERKVADRIVEYEEVLGFHLEQAYRLREELAPVDRATRALGLRAARLLASAGYRAVSRSDNQASAVLLGRAEKLFGDDAAGLRLLPDLGQALWETGDLAGAKAVFGRAIREATASGNRGVAARAVVARAIMTTGGFAEARREVEATIPILSELGDEVGLARAWNRVGMLSFWEGRIDKAEDAWQRSMAHGQAAGDRVAVNGSRVMLGASAVYGPTPVDEALQRLREFLDEAPGEVVVEAFLLGGIGALLAMKGEFEEARKAIFQSRTMLEDLGFNIFAADTQEDGDIEMLAGDPHQAEKELRKGYDALGEMGEVGFRFTVASKLAHALCAQGGWEEAMWLTEAAEAAAGDDDVITQILWRGARAKVLAHQGSQEEAETLARAAVVMAGTDYITNRGDALMDLGEILRQGNKVGDSRAAFQEALDLFEQKGNVVSAERARAALEAHPQ
jgi:class 3 adenylate cyclase/tetratricopeptide (TPR) repeat protein